MKTGLASIIIFLLGQPSIAQDYFTLVVKDEQTTYNYPENAKITVVDSAGNTSVIQKDDAITLKGSYTLSIKTPWQKEPEILKSDGGVLEIFALPIERRNYRYEEHPFEITNYDTIENQNEPTLERKEIMRSKKYPERYNILAVFTNGLVFKYEDGNVRAWLENTEITVTNRYIVQTPEGLLKLSFDSTNGAFWYVFDS